MRRSLICGGSGFIARHLTRKLKARGDYVRIIAHREPDTPHDDFYPPDLRWVASNDWIFADIDDVYQLAAVGGGLGYVHDRSHAATVLRDNVRININVLEACRHHKVKKVFFASSGGVYPPLLSPLSEIDDMPADPNGEYAWEKLFSERLYQAYCDNHGLDVRVGRLFNTYGPDCAYDGGKERVVGALCRKVAQACYGGTVQIWGSGQQTRSLTYVEDIVDGILALMETSYTGPVNIGSTESIPINALVRLIAKAAGKKVLIRSISGSVGASARDPDTTLMKDLTGWEPKVKLEEGIPLTYKWVKEQIDKKLRSGVELQSTTSGA